MPVQPTKIENHLADLVERLEGLATTLDEADNGLILPLSVDRERTRADQLRAAAQVIAALPCRHAPGGLPADAASHGTEASCRYCGAVLRTLEDMTAATTEATRPTTIDEIRSRATIPVHSATEPNYAGLVGIGRALAYRAAAVGDDVPTIRVGGRVLVAVPALLEKLGVTA